MPTPINTISAPSPTPTMSPANVPRGKPSLGGGSKFTNVPFGGSATGAVLLETGGGEGEVVLGEEGSEVGDGDGGVAISGEDRVIGRRIPMALNVNLEHATLNFI
ncbi:hypothetical protein F3Y22_tig00110194pilonHSYRG00050 [Hibiscus syriacus]|uniref:Uncharacterized protein n=1 Tax=Hibiscus syriacus TaxID=106335 RepID=A0A6A3BGW6_HIBSY|nr:hypothetical protein F3Y22_tig00110194pilonHSYRG00050 [Hibiscus syriacus]